MSDKKKLVTVIMGGGVVVLLLAYLSIAGPGMVKYINLDTFFKHKTTELLVFLGIGVILHVFLTRTKKESFHFVADAIVVAATIGLMVEVRHIRETHERVDVQGEWLYEVQNGSGYITHGGISTIRQEDDGTLVIEGRRKYRQYCGKENKCGGAETQLEFIANDGNYWRTDFAMIHGGETKVVDFVYTILLNESSTRGYCRLTPDTNDKKPRKLEGTYTHLAPGKLMGDIIFTRTSRLEAMGYIKSKVEASNPTTSRL